MIIATVTGNLGKDAETKDVSTKNGNKTIVKFSVASNEGKGDDKQTTWVGVTLWRSPGIAKFLTRGTKVTCVGTLKTEVGKDGKTYVVMDADHVDFGGSNKDASNDRASNGGGNGYDRSPPSSQEPLVNDDIPFASCSLTAEPSSIARVLR